MTKKAIPNIILLSEKFNVLQLSILSDLNVYLLLGTADAEILRFPSGKNPKLTNVLP